MTHSTELSNFRYGKYGICLPDKHQLNYRDNSENIWIQIDTTTMKETYCLSNSH